MVDARVPRDEEECVVILLGSYDNSVTQADRDAYLRQATAISGGRADQAADGSDKLSFEPYTPEPDQPMTVAAVQQALKTTGFFPGGKVDGICGYRTRAAMRLFQEYVRSVEKLPSEHCPTSIGSALPIRAVTSTAAVTGGPADAPGPELVIGLRSLGAWRRSYGC